MSITKSERRSSWPMDVMWPEQRVDRAFRDMLRDFFTGSMFSEQFFEGHPMAMRLEEFVENGTGVIRAELPDLDPDKDVELTVDDGVLTLRAHREQRKEEKKAEGYRSEFQYGSLQRRIRLPEGVTESDIKATYKDGILEVRVPLPKPAEASATSPTKIEVKRD